jgi:hypothetical protein
MSEQIALKYLGDNVDVVQPTSVNLLSKEL